MFQGPFLVLIGQKVFGKFFGLRNLGLSHHLMGPIANGMIQFRRCQLSRPAGLLELSGTLFLL